MSRWMIEKSGTGIEKSGTGIEKSGTGIEKSGTGIEKSGTGIEKSGTGIENSGTGLRRAWMSVAMSLIVFASGIQASTVNPAGALQLVVERDTVAVSWIVDGSVFSGVSKLSGSFASFVLTELALSSSSIDVTGAGTGGLLDVTGAGTGGQLDVTGAGTGGQLDVTGAGTGGNLDVTGAGTGGQLDVTGAGTGGNLDVTGAGTGSSINVTGAGTGANGIVITLPEGTGLAMEVVLGCGSATVSVLDADSVEVVSFADVPVIGAADFCGK